MRTGRDFRLGLVLGLASGVLLTVTITVGAATLTIRRGVAVELSLEGLATTVAARVRTEAAAELPTVLAQARESMPQHVEDEMRGAIGTASVSIGGISLPLPEELVRDLERRLAVLVEESVYGVLDSLDLSGVVDRLAERAYAMVLGDLSSELGRTPISIRGPLNLRVPVTVKTGR